MLSVREEARPLPLGPLQHPGPQPPGTVRFVCVSDTHSNAPKQPLPAGDCLIHAGDFTDTGRPQELEAFCTWLKAQPHARKIVIAGNHDLTLDPDPSRTLIYRSENPTTYTVRRKQHEN